MRRLNLGCGSLILPGHVNLDIADIPGVDVVHDLDQLPWPFGDREFDRIEAKDVFEHVNDPIGFMTECHRILAPNGVVRIRTPYYRSPDAFTDPTHKRFPTEHTFDYWIPGTVLYAHHNPAYGGVGFDQLSLGINDEGQLDTTLRRIG